MISVSALLFILYVSQALGQTAKVRLLRNDSAIVMGVKEDVKILRTGENAVKMTASLDVEGALRIHSKSGSVYNNLWSYFAPSTISLKKSYLYIKTNIPMSSDTQFRFKVEGYAPYVADAGNIDSTIVGWRQSSKGKKDCVVNVHAINNGYGKIGAYCDSNTGEVVIGMSFEDGREVGVTLSAHLVNPRGYAHNLKVNDFAFTSEEKYFAPSKKNCNDLRKAGNTKSGIYEIKPIAEGAAFKVYCDMETDGGGWTLVAGFERQSGFQMWSHRSNGYRVGELIKNPTGKESAPTVMSQTNMEAIWFSGKQEYMTLCGRSTSGSIVAKFTVPGTTKSNFDVFRGIYDAKYTKDRSGVKAYIYQAGNGNPLGKSVTFAASSLGTKRDCGTTGKASNCYHYLPDDINGGGRWAFRENNDDTPTSYGGSSSNVPSKIFIR